MGKSKIKGKDLKKIGFQSDVAKSLALQVLNSHFKFHSKQEKIELITKVLQSPEDFTEEEPLNKIANEILGKVETAQGTKYHIEDEPKPYRVFGGKHITRPTIDQMDMAMRLPVATQGALMPDAHVGYGLPIGGVLATENAVIPYAVGLDIGCRMSLTLYDVPTNFTKRYSYGMKTALKEHTFFGIGKISSQQVEHEVLDSPEFNELPLLKQLHGKAVRQLGTSGSGNHFVEFGEVELREGNALNVPAGKYLGLMAHSGSRGFGAAIANYYTTLAKQKCILHRSVQHLAWLDLDTEEGMEYWLSMSLAGDYAKACHDVIHHKLAKALGLKPLAKIENHHNFAWKEEVDGQTQIVHRKGATPAQEGVLGIIPASMSSTGYIVSGKGNSSTLHSASHGAGRKMTRTRARESFTQSYINKVLREEGVQLIGGGRDEAPMVYKDIEQVMQSQRDLVRIEGKFTPKIVRMDRP